MLRVAARLALWVPIALVYWTFFENGYDYQFHTLLLMPMIIGPVYLISMNALRKAGNQNPNWWKHIQLSLFTAWIAYTPWILTSPFKSHPWPEATSYLLPVVLYLSFIALPCASRLHWGDRVGGVALIGGACHFAYCEGGTLLAWTVLLAATALGASGWRVAIECDRSHSSVPRSDGAGESA